MSINYISFYLKYMAFFYIKPYFLFCKNIIIKNYYHNSFYGAINNLYLKSTTRYTVGIIFYIKNTFFIDSIHISKKKTAAGKTTAAVLSYTFIFLPQYPFCAIPDRFLNVSVCRSYIHIPQLFSGVQINGI